MEFNGTGIPWEEPGWETEARNWLDARLDEICLGFTGRMEEIHNRPWSTVWKVETKTGRVFFKASIPALAHEPGLTWLLSRWQPDVILSPLAVERKKGWMILPDGGMTLRECLQKGNHPDAWNRILPLYAAFQASTAGRLDALLEVGTLDRRLAALPDALDALLTDLPALRIGQVDGLTESQFERLQAIRPLLEQVCTRLGSLPVPETLHHDDFHDANIFVEDGRFHFFDWGESCVSHPFFTMVVCLRSIAYRRGLPDDDPEITRLKNIYLGAWRDFASQDSLEEALSLAMPLGMLSRALTWHLVLSSIPEKARQGNLDAVPGWLGDFLEAAHQVAG